MPTQQHQITVRQITYKIINIISDRSGNNFARKFIHI